MRRELRVGRGGALVATPLLLCPYAPECVEGVFSEVGLPLYGVPGSRGVSAVIGGEDTGMALGSPVRVAGGVGSGGRARIVLGDVDRWHGRRSGSGAQA